MRIGRSEALAVVTGLALAAGCTIDFDRFDFDERSDAAAGLGGVGGLPTGGAAGGGVGGSGGGGTGGQGDAGPDVVTDASDADAPDTTCPAGQKRCGDACVDESDPAFGCGPATCTPCALSQATAGCENGACAVATCLGSFEDCDNRADNGCESSTSSDPQHCGGCNDPCGLPSATPGCVAGQCVVTGCASGFGDCDSRDDNGCETNLMTDSLRCGSCTTSCEQVAGVACDNGDCVNTPCPLGFGDCDDDPGNGCETDLSTTVAHCGACSDPCLLANATAVCVGGTCAVAACSGTFANCDGMAETGCEEDLRVNANHCGGCGDACSAANSTSRTCLAGICSHQCAPGFANCNGPAPGATDDGCEADLESSLQNCGACGVACVNPNGTTACIGGRCMPTCSPGFSNCDGDPTNGCETNTSTSLQHCGSCIVACANPNGSAACISGVCAPSCAPGFGDCDGNELNGCETNLDSNVQHCGACNAPCSLANTAARACVAGQCAPTCAGDFRDCDGPEPGATDDGCEAHLLTDAANCGACGRACGAQNVLSKACVAGVCASTCQLGFGNCLRPAAPAADDGCEQSTAGDPANCGGCGNSCTAQTDVGLVCGATAPGQCGCGGDANRCRQRGSGGTCDASGLCRCGVNVCAPGEGCTRVGADPNDRCSCNRGSSCSPGQTCCQTAGCRDLTSDAANCGACNRECPAGFACQSGQCACTTSGQCNAGSAGTCSGGRCACGNATCASGQRCQPSGACG